jgi:hypothetical protein
MLYWQTDILQKPADSTTLFPRYVIIERKKKLYHLFACLHGILQEITKSLQNTND